MRSKKILKRVLSFLLSAIMVFTVGSSAFANTQALPNGTIVSQNGTKYLTDSSGNKYSGWFIDSKEDWYYFSESDKSMKTGWHNDDKDGYMYYLNPSDGRMATGWQTIDGKEYFFQPVRDRGNYLFNSEQEKWLYELNSKIPYGAMYVDTTTPDGSKVDNTGAKVDTSEKSTNSDNSNVGINNSKNGWVGENGKWYYYEEGVVKKNSWLNLDGKWYYVIADGSMVVNGWKEISGKSYYFGSDGAMYVNTSTPDGSTVDSNGLKILVPNSSSEVYNYSKYIGNYSNLEDYQNEYWDVSMGFVQYISINDISNGKVYGISEYGYMELSKENFESGVSIKDNSFSTVGTRENWEKGDSSPYETVTYTASYTFSEQDKKPVIIRNDGTVFYLINGEPK